METTDNKMAPDNTGKGSGPWQCFACLARHPMLQHGYDTKCDHCGSYEIHWAPEGQWS